MAVLAGRAKTGVIGVMGGWSGCGSVMEGEGDGIGGCSVRGEGNGLSKGFFSSKGFSCEGVRRDGGGCLWL